MVAARNTESEPRTVDAYMQIPYRMEIYWDNDYWAAEFPELPGLAAAGDTWEELYAMIDDAKRAWFAGMLDLGKPIPEPRPREEEFSGKLVVRLPKSMHRAAAIAADRDGVSLNTYIVGAVSAAVARTA